MTVNHSAAECAGSARWDVVALPLRAGLGEGDDFVVIPRVVYAEPVPMAVPAPHVHPLCAVELRRAAVCVEVVVGAVELAVRAVVRHQVAAQPQQGGQVAQHVDVAVGLADGRGLVFIPYPPGNAAVEGAEGGSQAYLKAAAAGCALRLYVAVLDVCRCRQVVDLTSGAVECCPDVGFLLCCECHFFAV